MKMLTRLLNISLAESDVMPVLDTVVLFATADEGDDRHHKASSYTQSLEKKNLYLAGFALLEFDIVLKSRGYSLGIFLTHALRCSR